MRADSQTKPGNQTVVAVSVLLGLLAIGGLVWLGVYLKDRSVRSEVRDTIERFAKLPGFDIEGHSDRSGIPRPTPEEIDALVGKPPDVPINPKAEKTVAKYSWKSPRKEFSIYVIFKKNKKTNRLEMDKGKVFGNP